MDASSGPEICPKDFPSNQWVDDIRYWPEIDYGDIYNYLISSRACDGDEMKNFKSFDSFNYFKSGSVGRITHVRSGSGSILLRCDVRPSQRLNNENHHPWVVCNTNGIIQNGGCTCMAGSSKTCSHVGAMLWKIEHAVKHGLTGTGCTDVQANWNKGTSRNIEPGPVSEMDFKKPRRSSTVTTDDTPATPIEKSSFKLFISHSDFSDFIEKSNLKPLFQIPNTILNESASANIRKLQVEPVISLCHSDHQGDLTCEKCKVFFDRYILLSSEQILLLKEKTVNQSHSELWQESRKLRVTGSTASKVPVRDTTNPDNFMREHLYPTFRGNIYTKYGQDGEIKAKEQLREDGHVIVEVGTVICEKEPWLSVSPDGILKTASGDQLLEIKCPFLKHGSTVHDLFMSGKYDVIKEFDAFKLKQSGSRGYFIQVPLTMHVMKLQLCKFVVYSPDQYEIISVPYDSDFCKQLVSRLRTFYFMKFLPRVVDDFESGRLRLTPQYADVSA